MFFKKEKIIKEHERNELRLIDEITSLKKENDLLTETLTETTNQVIEANNKYIDAKRELRTTKELCENKNQKISELVKMNKKLVNSTSFGKRKSRIKVPCKTI